MKKFSSILIATYILSLGLILDTYNDFKIINEDSRKILYDIKNRIDNYDKIYNTLIDNYKLDEYKAVQLSGLINYFSKKFNINYYYIIATIRVESNFDICAYNPRTNCYGLFQVWDTTGMECAEELNVEYYDGILLDPYYNSLFGTYYLKKMLNSFDNNFKMATMAYNIGIGRYKKILAGIESLPKNYGHWIKIAEELNRFIKEDNYG